MRGLLAPLVKFLLFMAVTITATAVLALTIMNSSISSSHSYSARFTTATGLLVGDDIRIAGVRVGQVEEMEIVENRLASVRFNLERDVTLPASTTATIKYRNLVGQRFIELGRAADADLNATLPPGGVIPLERTSPALDLTVLFNGFKPLFQALEPEQLNKLSYEVIQVFQGEGPTINSLLAHTASLTSTIAGKDKVIGEVIKNLNSALDTINARGGELSKLVVTVQQLVSGLAEDRKPIGDAIAALSELSSTTAGLLEQARGPIKADVAALGLLSTNLNDSKDVVERFVRNLPDKLNTITRTTTYGGWANIYTCMLEYKFPGSEPIVSDEPRCKP